MKQSKSVCRSRRYHMCMYIQADTSRKVEFLVNELLHFRKFTIEWESLVHGRLEPGLYMSLRLEPGFVLGLGLVWTRPRHDATMSLQFEYMTSSLGPFRKFTRVGITACQHMLGLNLIYMHVIDLGLGLVWTRLGHEAMMGSRVELSV